MSATPSMRTSAAIVPRHGRKARHPRALLTRALLPLLILAIIVLPGLAAGSPCVPGSMGCPGPAVLVVPDCYTAPGLTTPPSPVVPLSELKNAIVPADDAGQILPGAGSVSSTGEFNYRIPIDVPAGRAGMQPSLALAYGSRGRNGHVGVGFQLEGISEINRCAKTFATEGLADGVHVDQSDSYCLDGHKLVAIVGAYGAEGTEYRTEEDTFARIKSHTTSDLGVTTFSVEMRDGRLRTYAEPGSSAPSANVIAWPIQEEHDRSGNSILYSYELSTGEYRPTRIDYNTITVDKVAQKGPRNVQFEYESRLDTPSVFVGPVQVRTGSRLKGIALSAPDPVTTEMVWRYDLTYEPGVATGASRLTKVQRCGVQPDGTLGGCSAAKQFAWNQEVQGPTYTTETFAAGFLAPGGISLVGDFSGRGTSSILRTSGDQTWLRTTVDPVHPLSSDLKCSGVLPGTDLTNAKLVDLYGDGRTRILAPVTMVDTDYYFAIDVNRVQSSNPNDPPTCELAYNYVLSGETGVPGASCLHVTDLNGDGLTDLIKGDEFSNPNFWEWHYRLNAPQSNPQSAWVFGPSLPAPNTDVAVQTTDTYEYKSFSRGDGDHRGVIFPASHSNGALTGFGLSASGSAYLVGASTFSNQTYSTVYRGWNDIGDGGKAAYADTDGDGVRNAVSFNDHGIFFERGRPDYAGYPNIGEALPIDWQGLDHSDLTAWRLEVADLDADGRDDLMLVHKAPDRKVLLFQINAQGVIHESLAPFLAPAAIGDFDADGLLDLVVEGDKGQKEDTVTVYHQAGTGSTDRIVAINDAGDPGDSDPSAREAVVYSNKQLPPGSCTYPQHCIGQGFAVVAEHDIYEGADVQTMGPHLRRQLFNYEDARSDLRGRGFLGFGTVRQWDADRAAETITTYDNATSDDNGIHLVYPGAMRPKTVLRVVPMDSVTAFPNARLSKTTYVDELVRLNQGKTYYVHPSSWETLEWEETVTVSHSDADRVHITGIDGVSAVPAHGMASPLRTRSGTTTKYDDFGNVREATESTVNGISSTTTSFYTNDTARWLIGQLSYTDVISYSFGEAAPKAQHKDYDYTTDDRGLLCHVSTEAKDADTAIPEVVTFTHDKEGLVTAITTSAYGKPLRTMHMAYEPTERVYASETWNDLGQASFLLFDAARGFPLANEDANGLTAHYQYDDLGRMVHSESTGHDSEDLHYKPRNAPNGAVIGTSVHSISATGSRSRTDQDSRGRVVGSAHIGFDGKWIEEATSYDLLGRIAAVRRPDFGAPSLQVTKYTYDNLDRPLTIVAPGGGLVTYVHDFFSTERQDTFTDRLIVRDLDDRITQSVEDASGAHLATSFKFGVFNRVDWITDPVGNLTQFHYDQRGRRTDVVDPDTGTTKFTYDGLGDVLTTTASGSLTSTTYDVLGRPTQTNHGAEWTTTTWDTHGAGRLAHTVSPDGVEQDFSYNKLGQLDKLTYTIDGADFTFGMAYDQFGRATNLAYPSTPGMASPFSIGQSYNSWGYLAAVYDPADYTKVYWRVDARNADGQLAQATLGGISTEKRTYDSTTGFLSDVTDGAAVSLSYGYYPDGSLKSLDDAVAGRAERFGYDELHRLSTWSSVAGQPEVDYHYDALGNLTEVWTRPQPFSWSPASLKEHNTYGSNGKPHALTAGPLGPYHYDARGRQDTAPGRPTVTYNERDLPTSLTIAGGFTSTFKYDASGARVKKESTSETVLTLAGLYERHKKGMSTSHVFNVPGGEEGSSAQVVYTEAVAPAPASTTVRYLHHEPRLGSVAAVTDKSGTLKESFYYDPFGRRTDKLSAPLANGPIDVPAGFTGHDHDDELGLINMRGRMYDPTIRRFLSADPHVTDPLSGQSYNRYSYVVNNPTNLVDPTGRDWWDVGGSAWVISSSCFDAECGGGVSNEYGSYSNGGYGGYNGSFGSPAPTGGTSGSTVASGGYGAPVAASENHRLTLVPTGPAAPGGTILGPVGTAWKHPDAPDFNQQVTRNLDDLILRNNTLVNGRAPPPAHEFPGFPGVGDKTGPPGRIIAEFAAMHFGAVLAADALAGGYEFFRGAQVVEGLAPAEETGVLVFRGTRTTAELSAYDQTGHLLSEAGRTGFAEGGSLESAYSMAESTHAKWLGIWGSEGSFVEAYGAFGSELSQAFDLDRTLVSVTTDPSVAAHFAGPFGRVFSAIVPRNALIRQTLSGSGESEFLLRFGSGGFQ